MRESKLALFADAVTSNPEVASAAGKALGLGERVTFRVPSVIQNHIKMLLWHLWCVFNAVSVANMDRRQGKALSHDEVLGMFLGLPAYGSFDDRTTIVAINACRQAMSHKDDFAAMDQISAHLHFHDRGVSTDLLPGHLEILQKLARFILDRYE